ncbi:HutD family protein [Agrobacterium tumefaciens]|uniref:HutD/Ves family protein n=1 Tax=Agrobacterium tumefaciens TaxID=358 RepID=UPI001B8A41CE|nr:HutD family protein [Agrobacterium tumefaciens]WCJ65072.1 HutD family protein [Agrobacterium tumefaciens]
MRHLQNSNYTSMPWKNGGGITTEIIVHPADASMADFDWRMSMADVAQDGPFSIFPGIDRTLCILEGAGMSLSIDEREPVVLATDSDPLPFAADVPVNAVLTDGPIVDLNVMSRRGHYTHRVERHRGALTVRSASSTMTIIFATEPVTVSSGGEIMHLQRRDSVLLERGTGFTAQAIEKDGRFFVVTFDQV